MTRFSKEKVKLLHQLIAEETGGSIGVRDEGLLESALESAFSSFVKQLKLVQAWAAIHEEELYIAWNKAVRNIPFGKIEPLR